MAVFRTRYVKKLKTVVRFRTIKKSSIVVNSVHVHLFIEFSLFKFTYLLKKITITKRPGGYVHILWNYVPSDQIVNGC